MAKEVPNYPIDQAIDLPPGAQIRDPQTKLDGLRILYIGALGGHYQNELLLQAVAETPGVELTICTGKAGWEAQKPNLEKYLSDRVRVVHKSGEELNELYEWATVCSIYMQPDEYRAFAQPMKVYEYLGAAKPIIVSQGTMAGDFIAGNGCGWTIPYDLKAAKDLLVRLKDNPAEVEQVSAHVREVRQEHTWQARAQFVIDTLTALKVDGK
ncbi:glycosyltransferase [Boudabousia liubingyangii]|uniref:glycosyltransferase n=1 Tax=Boudabousia liubingyangii TaxID=1921764 RepID=UPI0009FA23F7|nr:glycosyltransferase [Boudabousia liubingyangii]